MDEKNENPNPQQTPTVPQGKTGKERLTHKEKRRRWKEARRKKREEQKEYYRYAPWLKKLWNLYLKRPCRALMTLAVVAALVGILMPTIYTGIVIPAIQQQFYEMKDSPLSEEDQAKIYELSPIDEDGAAKIDAIAPVEAEDTWTVCVYLVGSNLEDQNENDLSYVTSALTADLRAENQANKRSAMIDHISRFDGELASNGLELPAFFYYPDTPVASSEVVTNDVVVSDQEGCASADIKEMTMGVWSDNIKVVVQTGGATRWSNEMVNPNRTQRFLYHKGEFSEVANLPLQPASDSDTLAEFIRFCKDEYPSDHRILVLWNHGGGPFGYGNETVTNGMFTLKDIRTALESVYRPSSQKPAFDIIGFDACLMSTLEVTNALDGFAKYYCLSEEVEPGDGWDYAPWLQAMTDDATMSPARVGRAIADAYTDYYMRENVNIPGMGMDVTFSVIDANKASELYKAYCALCEAQLKDAVTDLSVLAEIGRCGSRATHYATSSYSVYNTVDLGNYVDYMIDSYPEECSRIRELLDETVLYHRENGALSDSTGIAVYLPTEVRDLYGLAYYLDYIYNISENDSITALYYYKQAGCLNDELKEYVATLTEAEPQILDVTRFKDFSRAEPTLDSDGFVLPVEEKLQNLMANYELQIGCYDEKENTITYYGQDRYLTLDGEGHMLSDFDGRWLFLNDQPLSVEVASYTAAAVEYRAHVLYDGEDAYLMIARDRDTDVFTITGVRKIGEAGEVNYLYNTRSNEELAPGARIIPLYTQTAYDSRMTTTIQGKAVVFDAKTQVSLNTLPQGYYIMAAVIRDQRGDSYYSNVVGADINKSGVKEWKLDTRFYGRDY